MRKYFILLAVVACGVLNAGSTTPPENSNPFAMPLSVLPPPVKIAMGVTYRVAKELSKPENIDEFTETLANMANSPSDQQGMQLFQPIVDKLTKTIKESSHEPVADEELYEMIALIRGIFSKAGTKPLDYWNLLGGNKYITKTYAKKFSKMFEESLPTLMDSSNIPIDMNFLLKMLKTMVPSTPSSPTNVLQVDLTDVISKLLTGLKNVPSSGGKPGKERPTARNSDGDYADMLQAFADIFGPTTQAEKEKGNVLQEALKGLISSIS